MKISVSYLASNYNNELTVSLISRTNANYIHLDLMDGGFVPHKNFTIPEILNLHQDSKKSLDIHLMCFDPIIYIADLAKLNPEYITFHIEATKDIVTTIEAIRKHNIKVGLALKPNTNILELMPYLPLIDLVLIMSVEPGKSGQKFITSSVSRLNELISIRKSNNLTFKIAMDGGLNAETIKLVPTLDLAVVGSFICKSDNYQESINKLKL